MRKLGYQSGKGLGKFNTGNINLVNSISRQPDDKRGFGWENRLGWNAQSRPRINNGTQTEEWLHWSDTWSGIPQEEQSLHADVPSQDLVNNVDHVVEDIIRGSQTPYNEEQAIRKAREQMDDLTEEVHHLLHTLQNHNTYGDAKREQLLANWEQRKSAIEKSLAVKTEITNIREMLYNIAREHSNRMEMNMAFLRFLHTSEASHDR